MTREEFFYQCIDIIEHWLNGNRKISDLREVTDRLYNEVTKPHWISVEDELPPKKSEYDGLSNNVFATDGKEIYESVYNHDFGDWFTHDLWAINNITHWMPLPAPPTISERYKNIAKSDFVKEHYRNKSLGDTEGIKDELDCIGSDGSDPFDEVEKQIESQHKKGEKGND